MENIVSLDRKPSTAEVIKQIGRIVLLTIASGLLITLTGTFLVSLVMGIKPQNLNLLNTNSTERIIVANKIIQIISSIGIFLLPALFLPFFVFKSTPGRLMGLKKNAPLFMFLLATISFFAWMPFLEWTIHINQEMVFPSFLKGIEDKIKGTEDNLKQVTEIFMKMPDFSSFLFTVFCIAIVPAIAEEFYFRGFLQSSILHWTRKVHFSIFLTGFIFSFIHFQFYGFLPRMLLGVFLGYLYYWTGDIKINIFVHFINNFISVLVYYISQNHGVDLDPDKVTIHPFLTFISIILGLATLYIIYKICKPTQVIEEVPLNIFPSDMSGEGKWVKVFSSPKAMEAEITLGKLQSMELNAVLKNKKDSAYTVFGTVEIYVPEEDAERAKAIIAMDNFNEN